MSKDNNILKGKPALARYNEIKNLVAPLEELLGSNFFCFRRIYDDGKHATLTTNPDWLLRYYSKKYYLQKEIQKAGEVGEFYPVVWDYVDNMDKFSDQAVIDAKNNNLAHSFSLKYIASTYMDLYSLTMPAEGDHASAEYLKYYENIKKFIFYFQSSAAVLINEAERDPIKVDCINEVRSEHFLLHESSKLFNRQVQISALQVNIDGSLVKLTKSETKCLKMLALGLSSKRIAAQCNVGVRTIEIYIESLRLKLKAPHKTEIIYKLRDNGIIF